MTGAVLSDQTTNLLRSNRLRLTSKSWSRALTCRGKWFSASKTHTSELLASFCHIKWSVSNRWPRLNPKPDRAGVGRVSSYPCPSKEFPEKPRFTSRPETSSDLPPPLKRVSRKEFPLFACLVWNQRAFELHTVALPLTDFPVSFLGSGRAVPFHRHQQRRLYASRTYGAYGQLGHLLEGKGIPVQAPTACGELGSSKHGQGD